MKPTGRGLVRGATAAMGLALTLVWSLGLAQRLHADEGDNEAGRAVRLSNVNGQVQVSQGGQMLGDHAIANTPLFEGAQVTTGNDGRAEVQFEDGSVARIPPASSLTLSVLRPDGSTEILLSSGMGYFELQGGGQGSPMRVRFGSDVVTATGFTVLRVKLDDGPPNVAAFSGNAHLEGPGGLVADLHGGESIALNGAGAADSSVAESIEPDSWDAWNADRDQALTASETGPTDATRNLPQSNNPAWGDLNANGTWYNTGDQGYVWSPYEAANGGWDPYGTGNWVNTPGYGYVWVSGEPWGYMPYQCGAWNYYDAFGWGWAPGGCNTWWGGGGYGVGGGAGWYFTIGTAPKWYKLPVRPGPPKPFNPHPVDRAHAVSPAPIVPVNRRLPMDGVALPPRDRATPVTIGGTVAAPLRPEPARPVYGHQTEPVNGMRTVTGAPVANWPAARPSSQPPAYPAYSRPAPPPPRPSYGGGGGRSSPPPAASHSSPPPPAPSHPK